MKVFSLQLMNPKTKEKIKDKLKDDEEKASTVINN